MYFRRKVVKLSETVTRPNNATQYAAEEVINETAAMVPNWVGAARTAGGSGRIKGVVVHGQINAATDAQPDVVLSTLTYSAIADNAAFVLSDAEALGVFARVAPTVKLIGANNIMWEAMDLDIPFVCESGSTTLYGALIEKGTYTPTANEVFQIDLWIEQD